MDYLYTVSTYLKPTIHDHFVNAVFKHNDTFMAVAKRMLLLFTVYYK